MRRRARREMKQRAEASTQLKEETVSENRKWQTPSGILALRLSLIELVLSCISSIWCCLSYQYTVYPQSDAVSHIIVLYILNLCCLSYHHTVYPRSGATSCVSVLYVLDLALLLVSVYCISSWIYHIGFVTERSFSALTNASNKTLVTKWNWVYHQTDQTHVAEVQLLSDKLVECLRFPTICAISHSWATCSIDWARAHKAICTSMCIKCMQYFYTYTY